jgi:hypothetical protein
MEAVRGVMAYDNVVSREMTSGDAIVLVRRCRAMLAAFATALAQFWEGYMHPAPGC